MAAYDTSAVCLRCGSSLQTTSREDYGFHCPKCGSNFHVKQIKYNSSDFFEFSVPMGNVSYRNYKEALQKITDKYKCDFLGYDDFCKVTDIGWADGFPPDKVMKSITEEIDSLVNGSKLTQLKSL